LSITVDSVKLGVAAIACVPVAAGGTQDIALGAGPIPGIIIAYAAVTYPRSAVDSMVCVAFVAVVVSINTHPSDQQVQVARTAAQVSLASLTISQFYHYETQNNRNKIFCSHSLNCYCSSLYS